MGWSKKEQSEYNPFYTLSFNFYNKDKDMTFHWVVHSKMNPIEIYELFKRKKCNDESDSNLKVNEQTYKAVVAEDIV